MLVGPGLTAEGAIAWRAIGTLWMVGWPTRRRSSFPADQPLPGAASLT